jgi:hypothetical protein
MVEPNLLSSSLRSLTFSASRCDFRVTIVLGIRFLYISHFLGLAWMSDFDFFAIAEGPQIDDNYEYTFRLTHLVDKLLFLFLRAGLNSFSGYPFYGRPFAVCLATGAQASDHWVLNQACSFSC